MERQYTVTTTAKSEREAAEIVEAWFGAKGFEVTQLGDFELDDDGRYCTEVIVEPREEESDDA